MKNMIINLVGSFFMGIFTIYLFARTIDTNGVIVCLISTGD